MEKKNIKNPDFDFELPAECKDPEISEKDFVLTNENKTVREQKFQTRPTTFLKDSIKRFAKNKSSLVATGILGVLLLLGIFVPVFDSSDTSKSLPAERYLEPKLFDNAGGFWDGTKRVYNVPTDISLAPNATSEAEKQDKWNPNPDEYISDSVTNKSFTNLQYSNADMGTIYGSRGYIQFGHYSDVKDSVQYTSLKPKSFDASYNADVKTYLTAFDTYDFNKVKLCETDMNQEVVAPYNYEIVESALYFEFADDLGRLHSFPIIDYATVHNIGSRIESLKEDKVEISSIIKARAAEAGFAGQTIFKKPTFKVTVKNDKQGKNECALIGAISFETESTDSDFRQSLADISFDDATHVMAQKAKIDTETGSAVNPKYWQVDNGGVRKCYLSRVVFCSFTYDTYKAAYGTRTYKTFPKTKLDWYAEEGYIRLSMNKIYNEAEEKWELAPGFKFEIIDPERCPVTKPLKASDIHVDPDTGDFLFDAEVCYYKFYGYSKMPRFLAGTDKTGRDMFKYVFEGLRTSLLLGICTFIVCFAFGLVWGSVSGYFGGTVDLIMERLTDILSGIPWIVVMTLVIIKMGSSFFVFALALCLTGWIGTAATTRTQFYRFRGREYVLASRTLGASHKRLIFKHILPNAMGTIITGAVLMIPSVIFSEASISYLGLGLKNLSSLGVILSNNQSELTNCSYLLIFPSVIIALLMISFNLFGNGLRDAVNPSLKGEGE